MLSDRPPMDRPPMDRSPDRRSPMKAPMNDRRPPAYREDLVVEPYRGGRDAPPRSVRDAPYGRGVSPPPHGRHFVDDRERGSTRGGYVDRERRGGDDREPVRRFEDDIRGPPPRRFEDDVRGPPREPVRRFEDREPVRRFEDREPVRQFDQRGPPRQFDEREPPRRFDDRGPPRRFDDDRGPPRRFDDDRDMPRRMDELREPSRRFEEARDLPPRRFEEARELPPRRFEEARELPPRRFEEARELPPRRFDDERRGPPPRVVGDVIRGNEEERMTSRTLFLGNLAYHFREADLVEIFKEFGPIVKVTLPMDRITGNNRGFAFVEFENRRDGEEALERYSREDLGGRKVRVDWDVGLQKKEAVRGGPPPPPPAFDDPHRPPRDNYGPPPPMREEYRREREGMPLPPQRDPYHAAERPMRPRSRSPYRR